MKTLFVQYRTTFRLAVIALLLLTISLSHYLLGSSGAGLMHSILGHLYIVPIILGASWFGFGGGAASAILSSMLFSPHLFQHWADPFLDVYNFVEIFLFLLIGGTTGVLSQMERKQRLRHDQALARLDESHRKLREQTDILFETEEQLRRADRLSALGELSAGMAHEIRNPLGAIRGAAEILRDGTAPGTQDEEFVKILLKETERLDRIVQDFLAFARPKAPELRRTDMNEVVRSVLALTAQSARKARVAITTRLDPAIGERDLDEGLMTQAILNLVLNAVQAMPQGGTLTVETGPRDGMLEVRVADTGTGISTEDRKRLFNPFFTTKPDGTGLGLAITCRIVERHHGTINVESEPGKGTAFIVRIPGAATGRKEPNT